LGVGLVGWLGGVAKGFSRTPLAADRAFEVRVQAGAIGTVGQYGSAETQKLLGDVPAWARGLIPLTGGAKPLTINLANLNTPQTAVDTAEMLKSLVANPRTADLGETVESNLGPIAAGGLGLLTGKVRGRGRSYPRVEAAARGLGGTVPEVSWYDRLHKSPDAVYPGGALAAISTPFGAGFPRRTNVEALNAQAEKNRRAGLSPGQRVLQDGMKLRTEFLTTAKAVGLMPKDATKLPDQLRSAIDARTLRYGKYASAGIKKNDPDYPCTR
jgi:hypothetical protein